MRILISTAKLNFQTANFSVTTLRTGKPLKFGRASPDVLQKIKLLNLSFPVKRNNRDFMEERSSLRERKNYCSAKKTQKCEQQAYGKYRDQSNDRLY